MAELARALPSEPAERAVVTELQAGSEQAFDWLVTHYHGLVYNLLFRALGDAASAADATQEVFLKAFRGIRGFRQGSSLKTWLYRIALREASNQRRWFWRHRRGETPLETETGEPAVELLDGHASPFERTAAAEEQRLVREALARIPGVFRAAVILRDLEDFSYEEVAEVLEVSVGTVKSRILRGRRLLKELLSPMLNGRAAASPQRLARAVASAAAGNGPWPRSPALGVNAVARACSRRPSERGGT